MNQLTPASRHRNLRAFIAAFISYLMLVGQGAPLVLAAQPARAASQTESASPAKGGDVNAGGDTLAQSKRRVPITVSVPAPAPPATATGGEPNTPSAPNIVATKTDNRPAVDPATANPGDTIHYTVVISNTGTADATGVNFSDSVDNNTTLVANSGVLAADDDYNTIGNVNINVSAPGLLANDLDVDAGNNTGMTATAATESSTNCTGGCTNNVTINADGSFTYDPPVGFTGTDTFTYTANTSGGKTATAKAHVVVSGMIWFINSGATACTTLTAASGCGRLSHPFSALSSFQAVNDGNAGPPKHPAAGDNIFLFQSGIGYTGPVTLLNNQKLIGQDATASLITITGLSQPSGTDPLPAMHPADGTIATINSSASNGVNLGQGNTIRGLTISGTTGAKISGTGFGTLLVGDSTTPDVSLSGGGQALTLTNGTLAATSGFVGVASTSSAATGITLDNVSVASGGTVSFGSTSTASSTAEGILVKDCTTTNSCSGTIAFGNTTVSGGTDGVSLTNNNAGSRTFGTLGVSGGSGSAFKNIKGALANGGGGVTVTGAATLSSAGSAVNVADMVASSTINFQSSVSATSTGSGNTGVSLSGTNGAGATLTFNSLTVQTNAGTGMNLAGGGTVNVTNGTGTINNTTQAASAIVANSVALNANFSSINSSGGTNGVSLTSVTGTSNFGSGALSGATGSTFLVNGGTCSVTYAGNITQANNALLVDVSNGHSGTLTFNTGTLSATNGGGMSFNNADGTYNFNGTNTLNGGTAHVLITNGSGGTFSFSSNSTITSPGAAAFDVSGSPGAPTVTYSGSITQNAAQRVINIDTTTGSSITFQTGTITGGASSTGININAANGNVTFSNGMTLGTSGSRMTNQALTITGGTGTYSLGAVSIFTSGAQGMVATNADGTINITSGTVDASGSRAVNISGPAGITTLGVTLTKVNSTNSTSTGITLVNTGGSFSVIGDNSNTAQGGNSSGGTISNVTGADGSTANNGTSNGLGIGVYMSNATGVSLRRMTIGTTSNFGVEGESISGFTMQYCTINGTNGDNAAQDEGSARFLEPKGTDTIDNCDISGAFEDNVRIDNTLQSLTDFVISNNKIHDNNSSSGNQGILIDVEQSPTVTYHITGNTFFHNKADSVHVGASSGSGSSSTALIKTIITSNNFNGERSGTDLGGGVAIQTALFDGHLEYNISSNTFQPTAGNVGVLGGGDILVDADTASSTGVTSTLVEGQIANNIIGTSTAFSGSALGVSAIRAELHNEGTHTTLITGNNVQHYGNTGIAFVVGGINLTTGTFNATVTSNTLHNTDATEAGSAVPNGINGNFGTNSSPNNAENVNLDISGNTLAGSGINVTNPGEEDIRLRQRESTVVALKGLGSNTTSDATVVTFLINQNKAVNTPTASASHTIGWNTTSSVTQPTVPTAPVTGGITPAANGPAAKAGLTQRPLTSGVTARAFVAPIRSGVTATAAPAVVARPLATASGVKGGTSRNITPTVRIVPGPLTGGTVSANIGTLHPGDSVTINFSVTVNTPYSGGPNVSNQGTVSGSNFSSVLTDDPDNPGGPGSPHATLTPVNVTNIAVNDAKAPEPPSGTSQMLFTLTLSQPAPGGGLTVNYATADQTPGAGHATGGASCDGTSDYIIASGTATVPAGSNVTTIPVTICADNVAGEPDETFLVNISSPSAGTITRAQATGTITAANPAGTFIISELRTSGPGGAGDDFVELYNNTDSPLTVAASDASAGYGLFKQGADCNATPVLIATIPNGTVIPARGHYLVVGSQYSLANYGGTGAAAGDQTMTADIENDKNVSVFSTSNVANISTANRFDAAGFGANTGGVCDLMREGNTLPPVSGSTVEYSFFRKECDFVGGVGCQTPGNPKDTNDNSADFKFADTQGTFISGVPQQLGAPGPENKTSPIRRDTQGIGLPLLDATVSSALQPNRFRDPSATGTNATFGTLAIRRRVTNTTGATVTRLRFRIVEMTTFPSPGGGVADLRALTSSDVVISGINDAATCASTGTPTSTPCQVTVKGTTLETPPTQPNGGGYNSTMTVTLPGGGLANNASLDVNFTLGVQQSGTFRFLIIIEALP